MREEQPVSAGKCCQCGCRIWLTPSHYHAAMEGRSKIAFHCGYGHSQHYCDEDDEIVKIRRERDRLKQEAARQQDIIDGMVRQNLALRAAATAIKAEAKRIKHRVGHGVCPCCNRSFAKLAAHMKTKHPDYAATEVRQ